MSGESDDIQVGSGATTIERLPLSDGRTYQADKRRSLRCCLAAGFSWL